MLRGYVLPSRRSSASGQIASLEAYGVTVIYVEGQKSEDYETAFRSVRRGQGLAVKTLADLATNRRELRERLAAIHAKGCYVVETDTGRDSRNDAADMIFDAADVLAQAKKGHSSKLASKFGKMGGRPRKVRQMPKEQAEAIWYDRRIKTNTEALARMTGWTKSAAHEYLGPSGRPSGKRPSK